MTPQPPQMTPSDQRHQRFVLLDGLRGIAALFIIQRHAEDMLGKALPSSYLGVDLFFALSGFVLAHAYGTALSEGRISPWQFMRARLMRLYPLYGLALLLVTAYYTTMYLAGRPVFFGQYVVPGELIVSLVSGIFFLPAPLTISFNAALFLVHPAWSLFDELVANLAYAWKGARAGTRQICAIIGLAAILLFVAASQFERLHAGFRWHEMYAGLARVFFSFFVGVIIYRFRPQAMTIRPFAALACLAVLVLVLAAPTPKDWRAFFDLFVVLLVWPCLLYVASTIVPGRRTAAVSTFLGTASYGVYVLHVPVLEWAQVIFPGLLGLPFSPVAGCLLTGFILALSWWLTVAFDQPLQRMFKRRILTNGAAGARQT